MSRFDPPAPERAQRPDDPGALCGVLNTLHAGGGARLQPVACPIALVPMATSGASFMGLVRPGDEGFDGLAAILDRVESEGFARLVASPTASGD